MEGEGMAFGRHTQLGGETGAMGTRRSEYCGRENKRGWYCFQLSLSLPEDEIHQEAHFSLLDTGFRDLASHNAEGRNAKRHFGRTRTLNATH